MNLKKKVTLGLAICGIGEHFQRLFVPGIQKLAEEKNVRLVIFSGFSPGLLDEQTPHGSSAFRYINQSQLDALVLVSTNIKILLSEEVWKAFYNRFISIPLISAGVRIENVPSIMIDNKTGIKEAVRHLTEVHARRRFAFIKGPDNHQEAVERFEGFMEEMGRLDIPVNHDWIVDGIFLEKSGQSAVQQIWDRNGQKPDALIACNDNMAVGALRELSRRGISVPREVSIIGFDDDLESRFQEIPLTTIHYPLYEQAYTAGQKALDLLNGIKVPDLITLPVGFIRRASCGCQDQNSFYPEMNNRNPALKPLPAIAEFSSVMEKYFIPETQEKAFLELVERTVNTGRREQFDLYYQHFHHLLSDPVIGFESIHRWKSFLSFMEHQENRDSGTETTASVQYKAFMEAALFNSGRQWYEEYRYSNLLHHQTTSLAAVVKWDAVVQILERYVALFEVKDIYIFLYRKPLIADKPDISDMEAGEIELVLNLTDGKIQTITDNDRFYHVPNKIIPDNYLLKNDAYVLHTLFSGEELYGYTLMSYSVLNKNYTASLSLKLSSILKRTGLYQNLNDTIAEKQKLIIELRESENRYYSMVEYLPFPLFELDSYGTFQFANTAFRKLTGIDKIKDTSRTAYFRDYFGDTSWNYLAGLFQNSHGEIPVRPLRFLTNKEKEVNYLARIMMAGGKTIRIILIEVSTSWEVLSNIHEKISAQFNLNDREKEILPFLMQGYRSRDIAEKLFLSEISIRKYISSLYAKFNVSDRKELLSMLEAISRN